MKEELLRKPPVISIEVCTSKKRNKDSIMRRIPSEFREHIQEIELQDGKLRVIVSLENATQKMYVTESGVTSYKHCINESYLYYQGVMGGVISGVYNAIGEQDEYKGLFSIENMLGYSLLVDKTERTLMNPHNTFATNKYTLHYEFKRLTEDKMEKEWKKFLDCLFKMLND